MDRSRPYAVARCRRPRRREMRRGCRSKAVGQTVRKGVTRTFRRTRCQSAAVSFDHIIGAGEDGGRELAEETWYTQKGCARPPKPGASCPGGEVFGLQLATRPASVSTPKAWE